MVTRPRQTARAPGSFDRFARAAAARCGTAGFFVAAVLSVVAWAASAFAWHSLDTWQLVMSTYTGIVTLLLVALLQNSQQREELALQVKLNALAEALADLMEHELDDRRDLTRDIEELKSAVGLERHT
jgi:low affinity Fe/Cu permease